MRRDDPAPDPYDRLPVIRPGTPFWTALLALLTLLCAATATLAQSPPADESIGEEVGEQLSGDPAQGVDRSTPAQLVESFMRIMRTDPSPISGEMARAMECMDLSAFTVPGEAGKRLAPALYETLREYAVRAADLQLPEDIADRSVWAYTIERGADSIELLFSRDAGGAWVFSQQTVAMVGERDEQRHPPVSRVMLESVGLSNLADQKLLSIKLHHWIGLFVVFLISVVLDRVSRTMLTVIARRYISRDKDDELAEATDETIRRSIKPFGLLIAGVAVYFLIRVLSLPPDPEAVLLVAARAFALIAGVWASYRLVDLASEYLTQRAAKTDTQFDDLLVPLARRAAKIFVVAFGLVFLAESFHLPITSLVAGLGIGGLAFAFAAKDTIENLFGSVAVILDHPFSVGDWIVVDDVEGVVEDLGFRSTRIRTFYNSLVTVPNAILVRAKVDNYGRRKYRRFKAYINVTYDTPPEKLEAFCEGIRELIRKHPETRKDFFEVQVNGLGAHSIDILLYVFFATGDWSVELRERHRLILDIVRLAHDIGVEFAFPTQTLHMFKEEHAEKPALMSENPHNAGRDAARRIMGESKSDD